MPRGKDSGNDPRRKVGRDPEGGVQGKFLFPSVGTSLGPTPEAEAKYGGKKEPKAMQATLWRSWEKED